MSDKQSSKKSREKTKYDPKNKESEDGSSSSSMSDTISRQYLTRYTIRPSTRVSYAPRSVRFRPVTTARNLSRAPTRSPSQVLQDEDFPSYSLSYSQRMEDDTELDTHSKKLYHLVKSITTSHSNRDKRESVFKLEKRRFSSILSNYPKISDLELILQDDEGQQERRFKVPRTDWMQKLEETARKNEEAAKKFLLVQDEEIGDICCCPMFTTHLFFTKNYDSQRYFKLRPENEETK